jgi:hypothetical protein
MKHLSLILILCITSGAFAQFMTAKSSPNVWNNINCNCDDQSKKSNRKIAAFGFSFGVNRSNLKFGTAQESGDQIVNGLGYRLGLVSEFRMGQRFVFSPKADLSFNAGQLSQSEQNYAVSASSLEFMGHLKYRFARSNFSPYLLAGPNYRIPLQNRNDNVVPTKNDLALDIGVGLDIPLIGFKVSPELRYSYGLANITNSDSFSDLNYHNIAMSLIFTGK